MAKPSRWGIVNLQKPAKTPQKPKPFLQKKYFSFYSQKFSARGRKCKKYYYKSIQSSKSILRFINMEQLEERVKKLFNILNNTIEKITSKAAEFNKRAREERFYHYLFSVLAATFSVLTPIFVSLENQVNERWFNFLTLFVSSVSAIVASIVTTFRWGEKYRQTSLTALELDELDSDTQLQRLNIEESGNTLDIYHKARELNEYSQRKIKKIIREYIEAEIKIIVSE
ncbi:MAG: DUF4231 domain-containing protein, partial [Ignavibacteriae bacterium]|nr:DUF4231 domain-containing protein [Ignavibacteriota bacterium]